jgi:hypothetical protein
VVFSFVCGFSFQAVYEKGEQALQKAKKLNSGSKQWYHSRNDDGSWQKRRFAPLNGVTAITTLDCLKVTDVECISKYCTHCLKGNADNCKYTMYTRHWGAPKF